MFLESGIVLPVPEAEPAVGDLRRLHDPQARYGVPSHITLLYPFAHPSSVEPTIAALEQLFGRIPAFHFSLTEVRRFPATAYLHPEPSALFVRMMETVARAWPEFPPYGGAFSTAIPHLTIADRVTPEVLESVHADVATRLPLSCRASEAWLMCSDERGFWSKRAVFPFDRLAPS